MKYVQLTNDQVAIVDDECFKSINRYPWSASFDKKMNCYYALTKIKRSSRPMHRMIMDVHDPKIQIDHINGNTLDNRKENLRLATSKQNQRNRKSTQSNNKSGYIGVVFRKDSGKWRAYVYNDKKQINVGNFDTAEEAAKARDFAAKELYGEFCGKLNFA